MDLLLCADFSQALTRPLICFTFRKWMSKQNGYRALRAPKQKPLPEGNIHPNLPFSCGSSHRQGMRRSTVYRPFTFQFLSLSWTSAFLFHFFQSMLGMTGQAGQRPVFPFLFGQIFRSRWRRTAVCHLKFVRSMEILLLGVPSNISRQESARMTSNPVGHGPTDKHLVHAKGFCGTQ